MKRYVILLLLMWINLSLFSQAKDSELVFSPLNENESLIFERKKAPILWDLEVSVINSKTNDKKVVGIYTMFEGTALLNDSKNRLFFTASDENDFCYLWYVDGEKGLIQRLINISPRFIISDDGKLMLYEETWLEMEKDKRNVTKAFIYDVDRNLIIKEILPEFSDSGYYGVMKMNYDKVNKIFYVSFGYEKIEVQKFEITIP